MKLSKIFTILFSGDKYREFRTIQKGKEVLYDYKLRYSVVNFFIIFGFLVTTIFTSTVTRENATSLVVLLQYFIALLLLVSFILRRFWGGGREFVYQLYGNILPVLILFFLFGYSYFRRGTGGFVGIWIVAMPLIALYTLGIRNGTIVSVFSWIWILVSGYLPGHPEHYQLELGTSIMIFSLSFGIWIMCFVYEYTRIKSQNNIYMIVDELFAKNKLIMEKNKLIEDSISYAGKIQENLLPVQNELSGVFSDFSAVWKPRDIIGGGIYWVKQFDRCTVLCVCDSTRYGMPGALLTMLAISTLESIVNFANCDDPADIIVRLDQRLSNVLHTDNKDGCDIAVLYIPKYGAIKFSTGEIPVFVCNGKEVIQHKDRKILVGEGKIKSKDEINVYNIPPDPNNKFYITTDGLFDQRFKQIILDNHAENQSVITSKVWEAFETSNDFQLIAFKP